MPRFYVPLPDGRWRILSTIVDDFITNPMTFEELKEFRRNEADIETDSLMQPHTTLNRMTYQDAVEYLRECEWEDELGDDE